MSASPRVAGCYVYPVKGMTALAAPVAELEPGGSVVGDRAFVFAFGNAEPQGPGGWVSKHQAVTLLSAPHLSAIESTFDADSRALTITAGQERQQADVDNEAQRVQLAEWFTEVVRAMPVNPLQGRPERAPLQLLGDGAARFTDRGPTQISLGALESLGQVSNAAGLDVDFRRFRLNFATEGGGAWDEFSWAGKRLRLGKEAVIEVSAPLQRCNAINASPEGAGRDVELVAVIQKAFGHIDFGVEAAVVQGGRVRPGDAIVVEDA